MEATNLGRCIVAQIQSQLDLYKLPGNKYVEKRRKISKFLDVFVAHYCQAIYFYII